jgi:PAS domain S-box-containing protein
MSRTDHLPELESLRSQVAELSRTLAERDQSMQDLREQSDLLRAIVEGTATDTGEEFFRSLIRHLAQALNVRYAFVGKWCPEIPDSVRTLAVWSETDFAEPFEYALQHTPCANVVGQRLCLHESGVQQLFPEDHILAQMNVESYCGMPLFDRSGKPLGLLVVMDNRPMTRGPLVKDLLQVFAARAAAELQRHRVDETLRESERRLRFTQFVVDRAEDGVLWADESKRFIYANEAACRSLGYSKEELLTLSIPDIVPHHDPERFQQRLDSIKQGKAATYASMHRRKDGTEFPIEISVTYLEQEGKGYTCGIVRDITERKRIEQERLQALCDLQNIMETVPDFMFTLDGRGNLVNWNKHVAEVTGYTPEELWHKPALAFVPAEERDRAAAAIQQAFMEGYAELDGHLLTKEHHLIPYHWTGARLKNPQGRIIGITGVGRDVSEQKRIEKELRAQRARLVAAQALAHVGSWEWDLESGAMEWSDEQFRIFGHAPQSISITHETFLASLLPDDHDPVLAAINHALAGQALYDVECRIVRPSGEVRTIHCRGEVIHDDRGHPIGMSGSALDVTDHKQVELALQQSEQHFRALIEHSSDIITVLGLDGTIRFESPSFERILGYAQQELNGRIAFEFVHEDDLPGVLERFQLVVQHPGEPQTAEFRFRHKDGSWRIFEGIGQAIRDPQGLLSVIVNSRDITERKRAEKALRTSQEKLRQALQASNTGLWDWNTETNEVSFSREWKRQLGYEEAELTDAFESWETRLHPDDHDQAIAFVRAHLANPVGDCQQKFRLRHKDGTYRWIEARASFVTEPDGRRVRLIGSHTDITERKQAEDALQFLSTGITHLSGEAFFSEMAVQMARLLGLEIGFVGKILATQTPRIRTIGLSIDGQALPPVEYDLAQTPCERVTGKQTAIFPEQAQQLFSDDQMLVDLGVSSCAAIPLFDMSGHPIGHVGVMSRRPLRQVKQVEDMLRLFAVRAAAELERQRTETKFHDLFEFSPDAIIMVNQEGLIALANRQAESLFGYSRAEFLGLPVETLMPEAGERGERELRQQFLAAATPRMMGAGSSELHALKKDGTIFPIDISLSPIQSEDGLLVAAAVRDITERKRAEEALRESEVRYRLLTEATFDGIAIHDQGIMIEVNSGLEKMFGYGPGELIGKHVLELVADESREMVIANMRQGVSGPYESVGRHKDGSTFYGEVVIKPHQYQGREVRLVAGRDITERKMVQIREATRLQRLKQLAAWSVTAAGEPGDVFAEAVRLIGELFDVRTVCLSEIVGTELYFKAVAIAGQVVRDAGHCPLAITPCSTVEATKELRMFDRVMERFPEASFLRDHQAVSYCGVPSLDSRGQVVAVTCLLDDKPHAFTEEEQELLRIFGQRIAIEIERSRHFTERARAEEALREREKALARFKATLDQTHDCVFMFAPDTLRFIYCNRGAIEQVGYSEAELFTMTPLDIKPAFTEQSFRELLQSLRDRRRVSHVFETIHRHMDGHDVAVEVSLQLVREEGQEGRFVAVVRDITERKRAEEALRKSEGLFRTLAEVSPVGIFRSDATGRCLYVNDRWCEIAGISHEKALGHGWSDAIHPEDRQCIVEEWYRAVAQQEMFSSEYRFQRGHSVSITTWVLAQAVAERDSQGEIIGYVGTITDITERKWTEQALHQRERELRTVLNALPVGVWCTDAGGKVLLTNPAGRRIWAAVQQVGLEGTDGHPGWWENVSPSGEPHRWALACALTKGEPTLDEEISIQCLDGTSKTIINSAVPLFGDDGRVSGAIIVNQDITERKALEKDQAQTQAFLQSILENIPHIITVKNAKTLKIVQINRAAEQIFGLDRHMLAEKTLFDCLPEGEANALWAADLEALQRRTLVDVPEHTMKRQGERDRIFWTKKVPLLDAAGEPQYLLTISEDITERKRAEEAVRQSHDFIRQIIDTDPNFIFAKDREGRFTLVNQAVADAYDSTVQDLVGKTDADFNPNAEEMARSRQIDLAVMDSQQERIIAEELLTDAHGNRRWLQTVKRPLLDGHGRAHMVLGAASDITERKRIEETLRQRERDLRMAIEERERISQDLHDGILQSLFAVGLTLETTKSMMPPRARKTSGPPLDRAIEQLNLVMHEIRNFIAGLGSDLLQGKDLPTALQHMLDSLTQNHATRVRLAVEDRAVQAISAEQSLHLLLVIQEAVSNCIRHGRAQEATVSLKMLKQGVRLSIRDNGSGFNLDAAKGTGLGLRNMAARAQKIGGRFTVLSKVNEGTRVVLDLPKEATPVHR